MAAKTVWLQVIALEVVAPAAWNKEPCRRNWRAASAPGAAESGWAGGRRSAAQTHWWLQFIVKPENMPCVQNGVWHQKPQVFPVSDRVSEKCADGFPPYCRL